MRGFVARLLSTVSGSPGAPPTSTALLLAGDETLEVVGESHRQEELWRIVGGLRADYVRFDVHAILVPDPHNEFDPNAVEVRVDGSLRSIMSTLIAAHASTSR